jgi:hypothetical protein
LGADPDAFPDAGGGCPGSSGTTGCSGGFSAFGNIERKFWDPESAYGFNAYVELMEILWAGYVWRKGGNVNNHSLYFGVENLPSLLYWMNR